MGARHYEAIRPVSPALGSFVTAQGDPAPTVDYNGALRSYIEGLGGVLDRLAATKAPDGPSRIDIWPVGLGADGNTLELYLYGIRGRQVQGVSYGEDEQDGRWRIERIGIATAVLGPNFVNDDSGSGVRLCKSCTWDSKVRLRASLFGVDVRPFPGDDGQEPPNALVEATAGVSVPDSGPFTYIAAIPRRSSGVSPATAVATQRARWR